MAGKFEREYSLKIRADASGLLDDLKRIMNEAEESGEGGGFSTKFEESVTKALSSITSMMEAHSKLWVNILETSFAQGASGIAGSLEVALSEAGKIAKKNIDAISKKFGEGSRDAALAKSMSISKEYLSKPDTTLKNINGTFKWALEKTPSPASFKNINDLLKYYEEVSNIYSLLKSNDAASRKKLGGGDAFGASVSDVNHVLQTYEYVVNGIQSFYSSQQKILSDETRKAQESVRMAEKSAMPGKQVSSKANTEKFSQDVQNGLDNSSVDINVKPKINVSEFVSEIENLLADSSVGVNVSAKNATGGTVTADEPIDRVSRLQSELSALKASPVNETRGIDEITADLAKQESQLKKTREEADQLAQSMSNMQAAAERQRAQQMRTSSLNQKDLRARKEFLATLIKQDRIASEGEEKLQRMQAQVNKLREQEELSGSRQQLSLSAYDEFERSRQDSDEIEGRGARAGAEIKTIDVEKAERELEEYESVVDSSAAAVQKFDKECAGLRVTLNSGIVQDMPWRDITKLKGFKDVQFIPNVEVGEGYSEIEEAFNKKSASASKYEEKIAELNQELANYNANESRASAIAAKEAELQDALKYSTPVQRVDLTDFTQNLQTMLDSITLKVKVEAELSERERLENELKELEEKVATSKASRRSLKKEGTSRDAEQLVSATEKARANIESLKAQIKAIDEDAANHFKNNTEYALKKGAQLQRDQLQAQLDESHKTLTRLEQEATYRPAKEVNAEIRGLNSSIKESEARISEIKSRLAEIKEQEVSPFKFDESTISILISQLQNAFAENPIPVKIRTDIGDEKAKLQSEIDAIISEISIAQQKIQELSALPQTQENNIELDRQYQSVFEKQQQVESLRSQLTSLNDTASKFSFGANETSLSKFIDDIKVYAQSHPVEIFITPDETSLKAYIEQLRAALAMQAASISSQDVPAAATQVQAQPKNQSGVDVPIKPDETSLPSFIDKIKSLVGSPGNEIPVLVKPDPTSIESLISEIKNRLLEPIDVTLQPSQSSLATSINAITKHTEENPSNVSVVPASASLSSFIEKIKSFSESNPVHISFIPNESSSAEFRAKIESAVSGESASPIPIKVTPDVKVAEFINKIQTAVSKSSVGIPVKPITDKKAKNTFESEQRSANEFNEKLKAITLAVREKTQAFVSEEEFVTTAFGREINEAKKFRDIIDDIKNILGTLPKDLKIITVSDLEEKANEIKAEKERQFRKQFGGQQEGPNSEERRKQLENGISHIKNAYKDAVVETVGKNFDTNGDLVSAIVRVCAEEIDKTGKLVSRELSQFTLKYRAPREDDVDVPKLPYISETRTEKLGDVDKQNTALHKAALQDVTKLTQKQSTLLKEQYKLQSQIRALEQGDATNKNEKIAEIQLRIKELQREQEITNELKRSRSELLTTDERRAQKSTLDAARKRYQRYYGYTNQGGEYIEGTKDRAVAKDTAIKEHASAIKESERALNDYIVAYQKLKGARAALGQTDKQLDPVRYQKISENVDLLTGKFNEADKKLKGLLASLTEVERADLAERMGVGKEDADKIIGARIDAANEEKTERYYKKAESAVSSYLRVYEQLEDAKRKRSEINKDVNPIAYQKATEDVERYSDKLNGARIEIAKISEAIKALPTFDKYEFENRVLLPKEVGESESNKLIRDRQSASLEQNFNNATSAIKRETEAYKALRQAQVNLDQARGEGQSAQKIVDLEQKVRSLSVAYNDAAKSVQEFLAAHVGDGTNRYQQLMNMRNTGLGAVESNLSQFHIAGLTDINASIDALKNVDIATGTKEQVEDLAWKLNDAVNKANALVDAFKRGEVSADAVQKEVDELRASLTSSAKENVNANFDRLKTLYSEYASYTKLAQQRELSFDPSGYKSASLRASEISAQYKALYEEVGKNLSDEQKRMLDKLEKNLSEEIQRMLISAGKSGMHYVGNQIKSSEVLGAISKDISGMGLTQVGEAKQLTDDTWSVKVRDNTNAVTEFTYKLTEGTGALFRYGDATEKTQSVLSSLKGTLQKTIAYLGRYFGMYMSARYLISTIRNGVGYVKELDTALNELQVVTKRTDEELQSFASDAKNVASNVASTTSAVTQSATEWARLGYTMEESLTLAAQSAKLARTGFMEVSESTEQLTASIQAFYGADIKAGVISAGDAATHVSDELVALGNQMPITSQGLGAALERSAGSLVAAGNTIEEAVALLATANATIQNPESIGTGFKTVAARLRGTKVSDIANEEGVDIEGMVTDASKLYSKIKQLTAVKSNKNQGISILTETGAYKSTFQIISEIADVWDEMNDINRAALLEEIAGKRQAASIAAIMNDPELLKQGYEYAMNAAGATDEAMEIAMGSVDAKLQQLKNNWQAFWQDLLDSDLLKNALDAINLLVKGLDKIVVATSKLGGLAPLAGILSGVVNIGGRVKSNDKTYTGGLFNYSKNNGVNEYRVMGQLIGGPRVKYGESVLSGMTFSANQSGIIDGIYKASNSTAEFTENLMKNRDALGITQEAATSLGNSYNALSSGTEAISRTTVTASASFAQLFKNGEGIKGLLSGIGQVAFSAAGSAIMVTAIFAAINGVIKLIDMYVHRLDNAIKKSDDLNESIKTQQSETQKNIDTLEGMKDEYDKLSKGVDQYGRNISLTSSEYDRYKEIVKQIVDLNPQLIRGYSEEYGYLINKNGALSETIELLKEQQRLELLENVSNKNLKERFDGIFAEYTKAQKEYDKEISEFGDNGRGRLGSDLDYVYYKLTYDGMGNALNPDMEDSIEEYIVNRFGNNLANTSFSNLEQFWDDNENWIADNYGLILDAMLSESEQSTEKIDEVLSLYTDQLLNDSRIIQNRNNAFEQTNTKARAIIDDVIRSGKNYGDLTEDQRALMSSFGNSIDIMQFGKRNGIGDWVLTESDASALKSYLQNIESLIYDNKIDASAFFSLSDDMSVSAYKRVADDIMSQISDALGSDYAEKIKLSELFDVSDVDALLKDVNSALEDGEQPFDFTASIKDLKQAQKIIDQVKDSKLDIKITRSYLDNTSDYNEQRQRILSIENTSYAEAKAAVNDYRTALSSLPPMISQGEKLSEEQAKAIKLVVGAETDLSQIMEEAGEDAEGNTQYVVKNKNALKQLITANGGVTSALKKVANGQDQARRRYAELTNEIYKTVNANNEYDRVAVNNLLEEAAAVQDLIDDYAKLEQQMLGNTKGLDEFSKAKEKDAERTYAATLVEMYNTVNEAQKTGMGFGTNAFAVAVESLLPEGWEGDINDFEAVTEGAISHIRELSQKGLVSFDENGVKALDIKNVEAFLKLAEETKAIEFNDDGSFEILAASAEEAARLMGLSREEVIAFAEAEAMADRYGRDMLEQWSGGIDHDIHQANQELITATANYHNAIVTGNSEMIASAEEAVNSARANLDVKAEGAVEAFKKAAPYLEDQTKLYSEMADAKVAAENATGADKEIAQAKYDGLLEIYNWFNTPHDLQLSVVKADIEEAIPQLEQQIADAEIELANINPSVNKEGYKEARQNIEDLRSELSQKQSDLEILQKYFGDDQEELAKIFDMDVIRDANGVIEDIYDNVVGIGENKRVFNIDNLKQASGILSALQEVTGDNVDLSAYEEEANKKFLHNQIKDPDHNVGSGSADSQMDSAYAEALIGREAINKAAEEAAKATLQEMVDNGVYGETAPEQGVYELADAVSSTISEMQAAEEAAKKAAEEHYQQVYEEGRANLQQQRAAFLIEQEARKTAEVQSFSQRVGSIDTDSITTQEIEALLKEANDLLSSGYNSFESQDELTGIITQLQLLNDEVASRSTFEAARLKREEERAASDAAWARSQREMQNDNFNMAVENGIPVANGYNSGNVAPEFESFESAVSAFVAEMNRLVDDSAVGVAYKEKVNDFGARAQIALEGGSEQDIANILAEWLELKQEGDITLNPTVNGDIYNALNNLHSAAYRVADDFANIGTLISQITGKSVDVSFNVSKPGSSEESKDRRARAYGTLNGTGLNNAYANGKNNDLVGELGQEMVVDPHTGRYYTVGDHGAEFVDLPKDAIVFNHKQTEALLKHGHTGRGKAFANGNVPDDDQVYVNIGGEIYSYSLEVAQAMLQKEREAIANLPANMIGNVDTNHRPIIDNGDGSYSTTYTNTWPFWSDEEGLYKAVAFTPILSNGIWLPDEELERYLDSIVYEPNAMELDRAGYNIIYKIVDATKETLDQICVQTSEWAYALHEDQADIYARVAGFELGINDYYRRHKMPVPVYGAAYANGKNNDLVGELGAELVVDRHTGRYYTVGENGPEFTDIPKDAIVFNHKQTEELLNRGHSTTRGRALVEGNAYAVTAPPRKANKVEEGTNTNIGGSLASAIAAAAEAGAKDWVEAFKKAQEELERQYKMGEISFDDYMSNLQALYNQYYEQYGSKSKEEMEKLHNAWTEMYNNTQSLLDTRYSDGEISLREYLNGLKRAYQMFYADTEEYAKERAEAEKNYIKQMKSAYESLFSAANTVLQHQINAYQRQKEAADKAYDSQIKGIQKQIDHYQDLIDAVEEQKEAIQDEIDEIQKANEERQRAIDLQKAQYELARAQNQRTQYIYTSNNGFVYRTDPNEVRDKRQELENQQTEARVAELQKEIDKLDETIEKYQEQIDIWEKQIEAIEKLKEASDEYFDNLIEQLELQQEKWSEFQEMMELAQAISVLQSFGLTVQDVFNSTDATMQTVKDGLVTVLASISKDSTDSLNALAQAAGKSLEEVQNMATSADAMSIGFSNMITAAVTSAAGLGGVTGDLSATADALNKLATGTDSSSIQAVSDAVGKLGNTDVTRLTDGLTTLSQNAGQLTMLNTELDQLLQTLTGIGENTAFGENGTLLASFQTFCNNFMMQAQQFKSNVMTLFGGFSGAAATAGAAAGAEGGAAASGGWFDSFVAQVEALNERTQGPMNELTAQWNTLRDAIQSIIGQYSADEEGEGEGGDESSILGNFAIGSEGLILALQEWTDSLMEFQAVGIEPVAANITSIVENMCNAVVGACMRASAAIKSLQSDAINASVAVVGVAGPGQVSGTANVTGTAYASGSWGLKHSESGALVGELGQETVVDPSTGRYYTVGNTGAEFVNLPKGAIVFNHKQTEQLFKYGKITGRGHAYANGTTPNISGFSPERPALWDRMLNMMSNIDLNIQRVIPDVSRISAAYAGVGGSSMLSNKDDHSFMIQNLNVEMPNFNSDKADDLIRDLNTLTLKALQRYH